MIAFARITQDAEQKAIKKEPVFEQPPHEPFNSRDYYTMTQDQKKLAAAEAAMKYIEPNTVVGVGTGSTANLFIEQLAKQTYDIQGAVASSVETENRLKAAKIPLLDLNVVADLPVYVDGADEFDRNKNLIKGGGGALTREKIIAAVAQKFVCIVDDTKSVPVLGQFPLPIEVIPMARSYVAREIVKLGGSPEYREGFKTDNGNIILDLHDLQIAQPMELEATLNNIVGVVTVGLFAKRKADVILMGDKQGVTTL